MNILLPRALLAFALLFLSGPSFTQLEKIDVQGHRGFRGMYPENTIPAFQNAIDLGVNTLEMDIVLSGENTWFVSHEPWLNHTICKDIQGRIIKADHEQTYNLYWLTDLEIKACDCGSLKNPDFPDQLKFNVSKPTLKEVLDFCEKHASEKGVEIRYSIELKSDPEWEGIYQPGLDEYIDFLTDFVDRISFIDRIVIQSFDERILRAIHDQRPTWNLAYLVSNFRSVQNNIDFLGFKPSVYSPNYKYVTSRTIEQAHELNMKIIPWTVNTTSSMQRLIDHGVDGIITDYPDQLIRLLSKSDLKRQKNSDQ